MVLEIKHLDFTNTRTLSLKTGQDGRIELGAMPGIEWVRARHPDGATYNWLHRPDRAVRNVQPTAIHATTDEMIEVAVPGEPDNADKPSVFSLLSKRKGFYERDYASAGTIQEATSTFAVLPRATTNSFSSAPVKRSPSA